MHGLGTVMVKCRNARGVASELQILIARIVRIF